MMLSTVSANLPSGFAAVAGPWASRPGAARARTTRTRKRGVLRISGLCLFEAANGTLGGDAAEVRGEVLGLKGFGHRRLPPVAAGGFRREFSTPMRTVWGSGPS